MTRGRSFHDNLDELGQERVQLKQTVESLADSRVTQADLFDVLELDKLGQSGRFAHAKNHIDYVLGRVAELPQVSHDLERLVDAFVGAMLDHLLDEQRMRLVAHLEHVLAVHMAEPVHGRLQVVDRLTHVALRREYDRLDAVVRVAHFLELGDLVQTFEDLLLAELRVA